MKNRSIGVFLLLCVGAGSLALTKAYPDPLSKAVQWLNRYVSVFTPEKIYVSTDRPFYVAGEILWFKAWVLNGVDHKPDSPTRTLYAELVSPAGDVVLSHVLQAHDSGVAGDFYLPPSLTPGTYTLRAYTSWMKNFEEDWYFRKNINILRAGGEQHQSDLRVVQTAQGDSLYFRWAVLGAEGQPLSGEDVDLEIHSGNTRLDRTKVKTDDAGMISWRTVLDPEKIGDMPQLSVRHRDGRQRVEYAVPLPEAGPVAVRFLPEGGTWIAGVEQRMAVKVTDASGNGIAFKATLLGSDGTEVVSFDAQHEGMAYLIINPEADSRYTLSVVTEHGKTIRSELPLAAASGVALRANQEDDHWVLRVADRTGNAGEIILVGHARGRTVFSGQASAADGLFEARVPKTDLPEGITHFTIFSTDGVALAERLIFTPPSTISSMDVTTSKSTFGRRDLAELRFKYVLNDGSSPESNFSVSVLRKDDANFAGTDHAHIASYLLLSSDLKGKISNPGYYLNPDADVQRHADLLMMTHGWRRFNWERALEGTAFPELDQAIERGITLHGTYKQRNNGRPIRDEEITIVVQADDPVYHTVTTDNDGRFALEGLVIADSTEVIVQGDDQQGKRPIDFSIDPLYTPVADSKWIAALESNGQNIRRGYSAHARDRILADRSFGLQNDVRILGEVVVTAEKPVQTTRGSAGATLNERRPYGSFDRSVSPRPADLSRGGYLFDFLRGKTPGFRVSGSGTGARVVSTRATSISSGTTPLFLLNGSEVDISAVAIIQVNSIEVVDLLTEASTTAIFGAKGSNGVISVFTKTGEEAETELMRTNTITRRVPGYYQVREFYAPDYSVSDPIHRKPDTRSTLWWAHTVRTNTAGEASLSFYTSDETGVFLIIVEGIDEQGNPFYGTREMIVQ